MKVLLVEGDQQFAKGVERSLKSNGVNVHMTDLGEEGIDLAKIYDYDVVLLADDLPDVSGLIVVQTLRRCKVHIPIIVLGPAITITADKVKVLDAGADDYMVKPCASSELIARLRAVVRRTCGHATPLIEFGNLLINTSEKTVTVAGRLVHLTIKEYLLLEILALRKGSTITKAMFLNHLYGGMDEPEIKIIDVFICKLRKKLIRASEGKNYITTIWGRGYALRDDPDLLEAAAA